MEKRTVIFYTDEQNDEFSTMQLTPPVIDARYVYIDDTKKKRICRTLLYRLVAYPAAFLYSKLVFHRKIVGKDKLKPFKGTGYFLYGNHTQPTGDALMQACVASPDSTYVIVHPNNLAIPVIGRFTPALGALPLPGDMASYRAFKKAIAQRVEEGHPIVIYPEAHIWPYYTKIRPFPDTSFSYPAEQGRPAFCFVNTYQKRLFGKRPRIVTYVEGPFYPDPALPPRSARADLRDRVFAAMTELSHRSTVERIKYVKKGSE